MYMNDTTDYNRHLVLRPTLSLHVFCTTHQTRVVGRGSKVKPLVEVHRSPSETQGSVLEKHHVSMRKSAIDREK